MPSQNCLTVIRTTSTSLRTGKLAIDYSDGVVEGEEEANQILFDYAKEKNKPVLAYPGEDIQEPYADFINKVCPDAE